MAVVVVSAPVSEVVVVVSLPVVVVGGLIAVVVGKKKPGVLEPADDSQYNCHL